MIGSCKTIKVTTKMKRDVFLRGILRLTGIGLSLGHSDGKVNHTYTVKRGV